MLLQTFLLKEPSKTFDASTTFDFPVSVCNSNLFHVAGLLECLRGWRCSISFRGSFWFTFFRFHPWWVIKSPRKISFSFRGFFPFLLFLFLFYGPQVDIFFYSPSFYLPVEWQEVTKRFRPVRLGVEGVPPGKRLLQAV